MKETRYRKIILMSIIFTIFVLFATISYGASITDIFQGADNFISGADSNVGFDQEVVQDSFATIYEILSIVGVVIVVLVGAILGIKFMISSLEERAEIKKLLITYVVGSVVIFGAFNIWKLVVDILGTL